MLEMSYIASVLSVIISFFEPFNQTMSMVLVFSFTGNFLVGLSYVFAGGTSGAFVCLIAGIEILVNYFYAIRKKTVPAWLVVIYALAFCSVNIATFSAWYDIFSLFAALGFVFSVAQSDPKYYRIFYVINISMWIVYDILAHTYGNLFAHITSVLVILLAIYVRDFKKSE